MLVANDERGSAFSAIWLPAAVRIASCGKLICSTSNFFFFYFPCDTIAREQGKPHRRYCGLHSLLSARKPQLTYSYC